MGRKVLMDQLDNHCIMNNENTVLIQLHYFEDKLDKKDSNFEINSLLSFISI